MFGDNGVGPHHAVEYVYDPLQYFRTRRLSKAIKMTAVQETARVYKNYTNIRQRKAFKDAAKAFKEGKVCLMCGSKDCLCVHHVVYHDDPMDFSDAVVLCRDCHAKIHRKVA